MWTAKCHWVYDIFTFKVWFANDLHRSIWKSSIGKIFVYKHSLCYLNVQNVKQKNSFFHQPIVSLCWHINNNRWSQCHWYLCYILCYRFLQRDEWTENEIVFISTTCNKQKQAFKWLNCKRTHTRPRPFYTPKPYADLCMSVDLPLDKKL